MFGKTLIINDWVKKDSQNSYNLDSEQGSPEGAGQDTLSTHVSNCIEYIGVYNSQCERSRLWMKGMRLRKVLQYKCIPLRQKKKPQCWLCGIFIVAGMRNRFWGLVIDHLGCAFETYLVPRHIIYIALAFLLSMISEFARSLIRFF